MLMSVSQYAEHSGMSRRSFYNWESKQGFPARVDGKIDQEACDAYLARYRDIHDPRAQNAKSKAVVSGDRTVADSALVEMSVAEIKRMMASGAVKVAGMGPDERAQMASKGCGAVFKRRPL
ncbi:Uncharacterised protein [Raoultella terrigena]|uniref:Uncharacterized protein n=1 Tax=Raoultella terrigena TaxID=577 RepID=A0A4U9D1D3_RAOTE|nr:Uncharacterised protein [Raoultella terrigena]